MNAIQNSVYLSVPEYTYLTFDEVKQQMIEWGKLTKKMSDLEQAVRDAVAEQDLTDKQGFNFTYIADIAVSWRKQFKNLDANRKKIATFLDDLTLGRRPNILIEDMRRAWFATYEIRHRIKLNMHNNMAFVTLGRGFATSLFSEFAFREALPTKYKNVKINIAYDYPTAISAWDYENCCPRNTDFYRNIRTEQSIKLYPSYSKTGKLDLFHIKDEIEKAHTGYAKQSAYKDLMDRLLEVTGYFN